MKKMFLLAIIISSIFSQALSRPQEPVATKLESTPIAIVSQNEEINPDGSFKFSYETANGIKVEQNGYLKDASDPNSTDRIQVIEGSVSYTDNDGEVISLRYVADENGFQPQGDHLPTAPPQPSDSPQGRSLPAQPSPAAAVSPSTANQALAASALAASSTTVSTISSPSEATIAVTGTEPPQ